MEELPEPSAELVLIRVFVAAHVSTISRRRGEAFLRRTAELLENEESVASLVPIRPMAQAAAMNRARREALAVFRTYLPALIASLSKE